MSKKVLIISTSLRKNSNSEALAKAFADGAFSAGNEVETVIIDGNVVVDERKVIGVDVAEEIRLANESAKRFSDEIVKKPWAASLPLSVYTAEGKY